ncbi:MULTISPECIES: glycoside hydrolase family 3 C-terminal domain-containing protein [Blautia]|uniref:glycoside hydrolase family 3 C-terminal domain-containing protein n=1 Tax=Blautia TaxID=572511 RepID=UPI001D080C32|nr:MULTISPECIES: glycoside hydrolase family 3 C-terminal domain-containing protein [Blautia]MCB6730743.1 glycoside hydrolase family 3 C-terminal domain-containing protein [Blautia obeum]MCB6958114.1 glycoside hydrolase family 3 C-terminal domain-containing protein [Blautia obeum]MCG4675197.1 glycoside hydrolase family 3 C-terminal domain-containing protein [Blautia obeum]MDE8680969.1 glycoside hydrolase family 3 C-terminal domain-containing protein [Blautia schinkii]
MSRKRNLWRGLTTLTASLLTVSVAAGPVVDSYRTDIDKFLGTKSSAMVTDSTDEDLYTYKSDYSSTTELLDSIEDLGERMSEEGTVLLKNENNALPLSKDETQKLSLLGFSSYYPVQGGDMGSSLSVNKGTDADTVDFVEALNAKGFGINEDLQKLYKSLEADFKTEVNMWGNIMEYYHITAPATDGVFASKEPSQEKMDSVDDKWKDSMDDYNVMLVTIGRSSTENGTYLPGVDGVDASQDLNQTDPLGLSDDERDLINAAVEAKENNGGKVIVMLNNANAMEIDEIKNNDGVDAIMEIGFPGGYGFYGVADILSGEANPSGHLTDTYAVTNANSPAAQNFGNYEWTNADPSVNINAEEVEAEDIYAGYKYYETRYADTVLGQGNADATVGSSTGKAWNYDDEVSYPFGYGLSYTTFEQTLKSVDVDLANRTVTAEVDVKNTGDVAGKDVVQLYTSVPYTDYDVENKVEKSAVQLLDYEKTDMIEPGESQTVTITADAQDMASWDSSCENEAGTTGNWILDNGTYYFTVGNGAHEAVNNVLAAQDQDVEGNKDNVQTWELGDFDSSSFAVTLNGTPVENQLQDADLNNWMEDTVTYLSRNDWEGTWPETYKDLTATDEMISTMADDYSDIEANGDPSSVTFGADNGMTLANMKGVEDITDERWSTLMDQLTLEECLIRTGLGGTSTKVIESITSPEAIQNDGPNGFNSYPLGQYANSDASTGDPCVIAEDDPNRDYKMGVMANETVIGQTFSKQLAAEWGKAVGNYSLWANTAIWWGVGTNLHRTPYNARNHEYFSEDAVLTAGQGAAIIKAGHDYGVLIAPKHLAFNDTEINRTGIAEFMTEQAARENELRGTQSCIEDANALAVMTTYNRVGCVTSNAHTGLLLNILHKEWGFKGLMSEDFIQDPAYTKIHMAVHNGVTMTCNTGDNTMAAVEAVWPYWSVENASQSEELLTDLKQAMLYQNYALANSNAMDGMSTSTHIEKLNTWYDNLITGLRIGFGVLTVLCAAMYLLGLKKKEQ